MLRGGVVTLFGARLGAHTERANAHAAVHSGFTHNHCVDAFWYRTPATVLEGERAARTPVLCSDFLCLELCRHCLRA